MHSRNAPGSFSRGAFFVALVQVVCAGSAGAADCALDGPGESVRVARVIDGDTLALEDGRHVRMLRINAPELGHEGAPDEPLARAATTELEHLLAADDSGAKIAVKLHFDRERFDHYGRTLAHVERGGRDLEREVLREGLAYLVIIPPNLALADCLREAERDARAARVGLWDPAVPGPVASTGITHGGYQRVRGRVERVQFGTVWWIEFAGGLRGVIYPEDQGHWMRQTLTAWRGETIEVRGWVYRSRRGDWRMRLPTPDARLP